MFYSLLASWRVLELRLVVLTDVGRSDDDDDDCPWWYGDVLQGGSAVDVLISGTH